MTHHTNSNILLPLSFYVSQIYPRNFSMSHLEYIVSFLLQTGVFSSLNKTKLKD